MRLCSFWRLEARIICSVFPASRGCPPFLGSGPRIILPSHLPLELCLSCLLLFFFLLLLSFIYFWLCWVFVSMRGLSVVAASGGHSSSRCAGLSLSRLLLLRSTGSRRAGSVVVVHGPSCSAACGIFPDQGSNLCPLHWLVDSQPLRHQGSPCLLLIRTLATTLSPAK